MPRYFIRISYKGTAYHGWQIQPNATSVQERLNYALSTYLRENIEATGAGRTDSGVHASYFIAHFDSANEDLDSSKDFLYKVNCILPNDITAHSIKRVNDAANARFDAISRTYNYFIHTSKNSFLDTYSYHFKGILNISRIEEALPLLLKHTDFTSFSKLHTDVKTNNCKIFKAQWREYAPSQFVFTISADRFLRNMVRAIVGTLLEVGKGNIEPSAVDRIIEQKDRALAGTSAPAQGLFLAGINYPPNIYIETEAIAPVLPTFIL